MLLRIISKQKNHSFLACLMNCRSLSQTATAFVDFSDLKIRSDQDFLPRESTVVICGGGVIGASVAYHLAQLGWGEKTILLEQAR